MASIVPSDLGTMPYFLQKPSGDANPIVYDAAAMRRFTQSILSRPGVLGSNHFLVSEADTPGMAIKVQSGYAHCGGGAVAYLADDTTINLSDFTKNPSTARTHKVYASVYDAQTRGSIYGARIDIVQDEGSGAGTPTDASWYTLLASIAVAAGQTTIQNQHITDERFHGGANVGAEATYLDTYLNTAYDVAGLDYGGFNARALYFNGVLRLSGAVKKKDNSNFAAGSTHTLGTLTRNLRPRRKYFLLGAVEGSVTSWRLQIDTDGTMTAVVGPNATARLILDGMSYELD